MSAKLCCVFVKLCPYFSQRLRFCKIYICPPRCSVYNIYSSNHVLIFLKLCILAIYIYIRQAKPWFFSSSAYLQKQYIFVKPCPDFFQALRTIYSSSHVLVFSCKKYLYSSSHVLIFFKLCVLAKTIYILQAISLFFSSSAYLQKISIFVKPCPDFFQALRTIYSSSHFFKLCVLAKNIYIRQAMS